MHSIKCPACDGTGRSPKVKFAASSIIAKIAHHAANKSAGRLVFSLNAEVVTFLTNEMRQAILTIEALNQKQIILLSHSSPNRNYFAVKAVNHNRSSHETVQNTQDAQLDQYAKKPQQREQAAVSFSMVNQTSPRSRFGMQFILPFGASCVKCLPPNPNKGDETVVVAVDNHSATARNHNRPRNNNRSKNTNRPKK